MTRPVEVAIADVYRYSNSARFEPADGDLLAGVMAKLRQAPHNAAVSLRQFGAQFMVRIAIEQPAADSFRWMVTGALATIRPAAFTRAFSVATLLSTRPSGGEEIPDNSHALAATLAPAMVMLAITVPHQQLWVETDATELTVTMPYQADLEYLALIAPAIVGMIYSAVVAPEMSKLPKFEDLVSSMRGRSLIPQSGYPLEFFSRYAFLRAKQEGGDTSMTAQRALMGIFGASEQAIAELMGPGELDRLRERISGAAPLPLDQWQRQPQQPPAGSGSTFAPSASFGYSYPYDSPVWQASGDSPPTYGYSYPFGLSVPQPSADFPYGYGYGYPSVSSYPASTGYVPATGYVPPTSTASPAESASQQREPEDRKTRSRHVRGRRLRLAQLAGAGAVAVLVIVYVVVILAGWIPDRRKLGLTELGILVVALIIMMLLLYPSLLDRISRVNLGGVELELNQLQRTQDAQREELRRHRFVLFLLLSESERAHLRHLADPGPATYWGGKQLQYELRRLRHLGLLRRHGDHVIADLREGGLFNIKDYVDLTEVGRQYLNDIQAEEGT